ncbi:MAG: polysaccharide biosynthesis/export family protein [Pseudomonadota bacterium]
MMVRFNALLLILGVTILSIGSTAAQFGADEQIAAQRARSALSDLSQERSAPVFGSQLFAGSPAASRATTDPSYRLQTGDRIAVRAFGAYNADIVEEIDQNGVLFIPEVGPVTLGGRTAAELQPLVADAVSETFTQNVRVYATLVSPGSITVYLAGDVGRPGRFIGGSNDDVLYFLSLAGGIHQERGSYRDVRVLRGGRVLQRIDLYRFLLSGELPDVRLRSGDTIFVPPRGPLVSASGDVLSPYAYELTKGANGGLLTELARPKHDATDVALSGTRKGEPFVRYLSIEEFAQFELFEGDEVDYRADTFGREIAVAIETTSRSAKAIYVLPRNTNLIDLLAQIEIDPSSVDLHSIHVNRRSVAQAQKVALDASLDELERSVLLAPAITPDAAQTLQAEAVAIGQFVARAREAVPLGTVTVVEDGMLRNLTLEDGDVIVIPDQTDVILVAGEVMAPGAFVFGQRKPLSAYVDRAGGFRDRANKSDFVVRTRAGSTFQVNASYVPQAGDQILVLPKTPNRTYLLAKDITQVVFQLALATATVARL